MTLVYITCKDEAQAVEISKHLLKLGIIACSNMHPIRSMYAWKGEAKDTKEVVILAKTIKKHFEQIKDEVTKLHSYDIPCILKIDTESSQDFDAWVHKQVT